MDDLIDSFSNVCIDDELHAAAMAMLEYASSQLIRSTQEIIFDIAFEQGCSIIYSDNWSYQLRRRVTSGSYYQLINSLAQLIAASILRNKIAVSEMITRDDDSYIVISMI